jgi:ribosomal protein L19
MKGNTYTGVVIGVRKRNSLNASFNLLFRFCGVQINMQIKLYSPMLNDLKITKKG